MLSLRNYVKGKEGHNEKEWNLVTTTYRVNRGKGNHKRFWDTEPKKQKTKKKHKIMKKEVLKEGVEKRSNSLRCQLG